MSSYKPCKSCYKGLTENNNAKVFTSQDFSKRG